MELEANPEEIESKTERKVKPSTGVTSTALGK
jgi:hypothetical protein